MAKRMLADVLWEAANELLWDGQREYYSGVYEYSCHAVEVAETGNGENEETPAIKFLHSLGCEFDYMDVPAWRWLEMWDMREDRQGVRYMWLLLAMHVAEDEGIEIEVSA